MVAVAGVYAIEHVASGRRYIGSSQNLKARLAGHRRDLERGEHHNRFLQRAWLRHGAEAFAFLVLEHVELPHLLGREQAWIDSIPRKLRYNAAPVSGTTRGIRLPRASVERSNAKRRGRVVSEETRRRLREAHKHGNYPPMCQPSRETRVLICKRRTGFRHTEEAKAKMSAAARGRKQSAETVAKRVTPAWRNAIARAQRKGALPSFRSPDGEECREIVNVSGFARQRDLPRSAGHGLLRVWSGARASWRGWTAIRDRTEELPAV